MVEWNLTAAMCSYEQLSCSKLLKNHHRIRRRVTQNINAGENRVRVLNFFAVLKAITFNESFQLSQEVYVEISPVGISRSQNRLSGTWTVTSLFGRRTQKTSCESLAASSNTTCLRRGSEDYETLLIGRVK
ncbi:unnamed protein product [Ceratitis capitata]|uniref:(Mediterranean fruit fly) hypothetical protein n=1 Tax=Ceratitis capitata TaxID=7213 RepID=A0A811U469_CERCA|nr:unnamed protein product [Ceratitis capitata]